MYTEKHLLLFTVDNHCVRAVPFVVTPIGEYALYYVANVFSFEGQEQFARTISKVPIAFSMFILVCLLCDSNCGDATSLRL